MESIGLGHCKYRIRNVKSGEILTWQGGEERLFKLLGDAKIHFWQYGLAENEWEIIEVPKKDRKNK